jgi:hypothetical protein
LTPEQFWNLHPVEFWWMADVKRVRQTWGKKHIMSEEEVAYLYKRASQDG